MENIELVTMNMLGVLLQSYNFKSIREMILQDHVSEDDLLALFRQFGPEKDEEYIDDALSDLCTEVLPLAYRVGWYRLIGFAYGFGYGCDTTDPLCGSRHPLAFGAAEQNPEFVKAFISGQKRFDTLTFSGNRLCEDGRYRMLPEELVITDCVPAVSLCLEAGMSPNAFCFDGTRIIQASRSDAMRDLLLSYGAKPATEKERNLVRAVNELRYCEYLTRDTANAFFSTDDEPLLKINWVSGTTKNSREEKYDIFHEAALHCHPQLLSELFPYVKEQLDDTQKKAVLMAVLGQSHSFPPPCFRILGERPVDISRALEALYEAGFRYGQTCQWDADHPILEAIEWACWTFCFCESNFDVQMRAFTALWKMAGTPKGEGIIRALTKLAEKHPLTPMEMFISRVRFADMER